MSHPFQPSKDTGLVYAYGLHGNAYLNVTNRCTLRCRFCPKFNGSWSVQDYPLRMVIQGNFKKWYSVGWANPPCG
ncbi:MAG: hypothetical protein ACYC18_03430 [Gammaproteobacteria bacterium]